MPLPKRVQKGQPITADLINGIIDSIRECQINSGSGYSFSRNAGGTTISIKPQQPQIATAVADTCPFDVTLVVFEPGLVSVKVAPGMVNGIIPYNMFSPYQYEDLSATTIIYLYLECITDGKNVTECSFSYDSAPPVPATSSIDSAPTQFNVTFCVISSGIAYRTIPCGNIVARVSPTIQEDRAYVAGERSFSQYYNWIF